MECYLCPKMGYKSLGATQLFRKKGSTMGIFVCKDCSPTMMGKKDWELSSDDEFELAVVHNS
jgi:hypothetical protein